MMLEWEAERKIKIGFKQVRLASFVLRILLVLICKFIEFAFFKVRINVVFISQDLEIWNNVERRKPRNNVSVSSQKLTMLTRLLVLLPLFELLFEHSKRSFHSNEKWKRSFCSLDEFRKTKTIILPGDHFSGFILQKKNRKTIILPGDHFTEESLYVTGVVLT